MSNTDTILSNAKKATKWSAFTEIIAKLISPLSSIVLARLLTPEAFGIVATLTMIISFAEIFTDAGFQKYLIQHEFTDAIDREESTTVAFWSNLIMSLLIWGIIALFSEQLAVIVGNPGLGYVLVISCISIPIASFSSIQTALFKRDFDFKTLFKVRAISVLVPLFITIPLACWLRNYWALIIGTIVQNLICAILLTIHSNWKIRLFYSFEKVKEMLSFTIWSVFESISIWFTNYIDVFIVGTVLSQYYLGLYKTSSSIVGQIMSLITAATTPILFSSLSRLQSDENEFKSFFYKFQNIVGMLVIPVGVGIFCFRDFITLFLLGNQWLDASMFLGLWGLTSSFTIVLSHYCSEVYRAKGVPKLSTLSQWLHIIVLWPTVSISVKYGFDILCISRSVVRLEMIVVNLIIMSLVFKFSLIHMLKNISYFLFSSFVMAIVALLLIPLSNSYLWQLSSIIICGITYFVIILFPKTNRATLAKLIQK